MKKHIKKILLYLTQVACHLLLAPLLDARLSFGVYMGASVCGNVYLSSAIYLLCSLIFGLQTFLPSAVCVGVVILNTLIHKLVKKKMGRFMFASTSVLSNVFYFFYQMEGEFVVYYRLTYVVCGIAFAFVCLYVFNGLFVRGLKYKFAPDEKVCLSVFGFSLFYSLCSVYLAGYPLLDYVAPTFILYALSCFSPLTSLSVAVCMGLASSLYFGSWETFAFLVLTSAVSAVANNLNRYLAGLSVVLCRILFEFFMGTTFNYLTVIPTLVAVLIYVVVPTKALDWVAERVGFGKQKYSPNGVVNNLRKNLSNKLFDLSDVFFSMQTAFKSMANSTIPPDKAQVILAKQVEQEGCFDCPLRQSCWRNNVEFTQKTFDELVHIALLRGKATILDVDSTLVSKCKRINSILSAVNKNVSSYLAYYNKNSQIDTSRLLVCEQLYGVSKIMRQLANDCKNEIHFDQEKEKLLIQELTFYNVLTKETVFMEDGESLSVIVTVAKTDFDNSVIEKIVSSVANCKMKVQKVVNVSNVWSSVYLFPQPRFDVVCGVANCAKDGNVISGDTHSFVKIGQGKYMLSVCDGMGSGQTAQTVSNTCISLVESFYKAGFDNEVILSSVNKLMSVAQGEAFSAVDICVINLYKGLCDFIKLGAPDGLAKINGKTNFVSGSALPMGVLEEMKPSVTKTVLAHNDMVVLASDGFMDCFTDKNQLATLIQDNVFTNPQLVADELLKVALKKCDYAPKDDMTVVVARVV